MTMVNLVLIALDMNFNFLFSAIVPQVVMYLFIDISVPVAMVAAAICLSFYLLFFFLSKRWRVFILIAFLFFIADTLVLLMLLDDPAASLLNLAFHGYIHFYLIAGTIAWIKLLGVSKDDFRAVIAAAELEAEKEEIDSAIDAVAPDDDSNKSDKV